MKEIRGLLLLLMVTGTTISAATMTTPTASVAQTISKDQQSILARWTAGKICAMGVDVFYSLPEPELKASFERETSMRYEDIPQDPNDQERARITGQLMGYLMAACPLELENYKNR